MDDKISVIGSRGRLKNCREYRCNDCGQLRFCPEATEPTKCGNCDSGNITTGRPGTLKTKDNDGQE